MLKPLALFTILYLVFGRFFKLRTRSTQNYPSCTADRNRPLVTFFLDATKRRWSRSYVGPLLRKMNFPRLIVPVSTTAAAAMTFGINLLAVAAFIAWNRIVPQVDWLLIPLLLLELYLFAFGVAIILSTLYVRFRDMAPVWEVVAQVLFYATPIIYPLMLVPTTGCACSRC